MKTELIDNGRESRQVLKDLKDLYIKKVKPVEEISSFSRFGYPTMHGGDFSSPPFLLLLGPYSAGKTTFIEYLVGKKFPGARVGPEPTTDKFYAIMHGEEDRIIPGNALAVTPGTPFNGLQKFGNNFLTRFEGSQVTDSDVLKRLTIIDTPGIMTGKKQTEGRSYNYAEVLAWFAERSDMIIVLFDVQKPDISDEMSDTIHSLKDYSDKIRVVLNKSDSMSHQDLLKVYGGTLWSLGRVITTPEVAKVYIGSFWSEPLKNPETKALVEKEMSDLMEDLEMLPRLAAVRKVNDMVKRTKKLWVHIVLLDYLRNSTPSMFGKDKRKKAILNNLPTIFREVMKSYELPQGDFPDIKKFRSTIESMDISKLPKLTGKKMGKGDRFEDVRKALKVELPRFLKQLPGFTISRKVRLEEEGKRSSDKNKERKDTSKRQIHQENTES